MYSCGIVRVNTTRGAGTTNASDAQYEDPATKSYLEALAKLEAGDPGAMAAFAAHVGRPTRQLSPQAAVEWCDQHADCMD
jgi:hypothetical protein